MIVTFYSFKGGVGRSMALANIGRWLQLRGLNVVMVDWDLEAPGLESYFIADAAQRQAARGRLGLLDLITTYKDLHAGLPVHGTGTTLDTDAFARLLDEALPPLDPLLLSLPAGIDAPAAGRLRLLTAGCRSEARFASYAETVQAFDWAQFYTAYNGVAYFEWLRKQLLEGAGADVVLIDSRTGVAEMSGICTRQLADVVAVLCAPNDQNLDGVAMMADSFVRPDVLKARGERRLDLVMVPARLDVSEGRPIDVFEANFKARLDRFTPDAFTRFGTAFTRLRIPYISAYAFAERLAVGEPDGVKSLQEAYGDIATHLALLAPGQSAVRRLCKGELQRAFGMPTVSVGALDAAGAAAEAGLRAQLEEAGLFAVQLPPAAPDTWFARAAAGGAVPTASIVLSVGEESLRDGRVRAVWRLALEAGVCLYIVVAPGAPDDAPAPRWPRKARRWNMPHDHAELLVQLQRPCQAERVPMLAPPPVARLLGREADVALLKQLLIDAPTSAAAVALVGMAGMGKTSIARTVCNDDDVLDHFEGGVLWATLGQQADLAAALVKLVRALEPADTGEIDLDEARRRLTNLLQRRCCLLVYDDVVDAGQMEMLPRGGNRCRVLMTTSSTAVAQEHGIGHVLVVQALSSEAARSVLAADLPVGADPVPALDALAQRLGGSPLALAAANRAVRARIGTRGTADEAVVSLLHELDQSGLSAVDPAPGATASLSLVTALNGGLELLDADDRARLPDLAALPAGQPVAIARVAGAAHCSSEAARAMVERLATASLVAFDAGADAVTIHPVVHEFLRTLAIRQRRVEATRTVTRQKADQNGIYISYRRYDTAPYAARLYDRLAQQFGVDRVFMDTASISPGQTFHAVIEDTVSRAGTMIVLIGPRWLGEGEANDFIGMEVATALALDLLVVPVLVGGARMPGPAELPPPLADLAFRNAIELTDARFQSDTDHLVNALERAAVHQRAPPSPSLAARSDAAPAKAPPLPEPAASSRTSRAAPIPQPSTATAVKLPWAVTALLSVVLVAAAVSWAVFRPADGPAVSNATAVQLPSASPGAAEFARAEALYFGRNGTRDYAAALQLYRRAAELGNASAQNSLGRMFEFGDGVPRDEKQAMAWYRAAARQGHPDATAALYRLSVPGNDAMPR